MPVPARPETCWVPWPATSSWSATTWRRWPSTSSVRLLSSGGELVTLVIGADAPEGLGDALAERVSSAHRDAEVSVIQGGQPHYPVLVGVE